MAWIELHQSLWTHKKTYRLSAKLGIDSTQAGGHLARFWTWALDNAGDGLLAEEDADVIALGAGWTGDPEAFVTEMVNAGWLDRTDSGYEIHDWHQYAGRLLDKRAANAQRARTSRIRINDVQGLPTNQPTVPTNQPNPTAPTEPADEPAAAAAESEIKRCFDAWFNATGTTVTAQIGEIIADWCERVSPEVVLAAIEETGRSGARAWKYTNAILQRWEIDGRETAPVDSFEEQKRRYAEGARLFAVRPP